MRREIKRYRERYSSPPRERNWRLPAPLDMGLVEQVSREAGVIPEVASILLRRSDCDQAKALAFLDGRSGMDLPELSSLPGVDEAANRIVRARDSGERVAVYSDFDCDGVTSAAILKEALEYAGFKDFVVYFPSRFSEGYGFHAGSAKVLAAQGVSLFITADCGIAGVEACAALSVLGRDVIVTDHHLPGTELPGALAVIDPHLPSWKGLDLEGLSGAGVAYLLALAVFRCLGINWDTSTRGDEAPGRDDGSGGCPSPGAVPASWAHDLLTLSIAGDGQPVLGLNRAWVRSGLASLAGSDRPGIRALLKVAGVRRPLTFDRDVTFGLVPRINAAGRLADPRLALDLLCTVDPLQAAALAEELDGLNRQRKEIEEAILDGCWETLSEDKYALCAFRPEWHEGVIGIACSRIRESYRRPAVLVAGEGDVLKGSVRGTPGFNVCEALARCEDLLAAYGGHEGAGGFSIRKENVEEFFGRFDLVSAEMLEQVPAEPGVEVDEVLDFQRVTEDNLRAFLGLEPFGESNPIPQVACLDCEIAQVGLMGANQDHVQLALSKEGLSRRFLWFGQGKAAREIAMMGRVDALFTPYRSIYRGQESLSPLLRDLRPAWVVSGVRYAGLAREIPQGCPVILYTWSDEAAESVWIALKRSGMTAALHRRGQTGASARDARAVIRGLKGAVISTAPWDLGLEGTLQRSRGDSAGVSRVPGPAPEVLVLHPPVDPEGARRFEEFLRSASLEARGLPGREQETLMWLAWKYPEKDRLAALWKFLIRSYPAGRVPLWELGRRWDEVLEVVGFPKGTACFEGGRLFAGSALFILEQAGLAAYDQSRRAPELVLRTGGENVSLEDSQAFALGERIRERAEGSAWRKT
jgi:single-stranded-DNA-specific exonuclease